MKSQDSAGAPRRSVTGRARLLLFIAALSMAGMLFLSTWLSGLRQAIQLRAEITKWGGEIETRSNDSSWLAWIDPRYAEDVVGVRLINLNLTPADLARLTEFDALNELVLYQSTVADDAMPVVAQLTQLRKLNLLHTEVSDAGLVHLRELSNLEEIWLGPSTTNRELEAVARIRALKAINVVAAAGIDERGLNALRELSALEVVRVSGDCSVSAEFRAAFGQARPDVRLLISSTE